MYILWLRNCFHSCRCRASAEARLLVGVWGAHHGHFFSAFTSFFEASCVRVSPVDGVLGPCMVECIGRVPRFPRQICRCITYASPADLGTNFPWSSRYAALAWCCVMRCRKYRMGHILLIGDAEHPFPPRLHFPDSSLPLTRSYRNDLSFGSVVVSDPAFRSLWTVVNSKSPDALIYRFQEVMEGLVRRWSS